MASGNFAFEADGYLQGKIEWSSTSNGSSANTSTVTAVLYARRTNNYTTTGRSWSGNVKIGSAQSDINFDTSVGVGPDWVEMARVTTTVSHNNDGSGSVYISGTVTGPSGTALAGNTSSGGQTVTLDRIPRYTSITSFTVSKRNETSFTFNWKTADTIDYVWYSTNNGSSWTGYDVTDGTTGSFNVGSLSPNTTYSCKLRVRRKDSQLNTDSSTVSQTTYDIGKISSVNNFNHGDSTTLVTTNPSGSSLSLVMKIGNTQILSRTPSTGNNTISFSDTELDNIYKLYGSVNTLTATFILTTAGTYTNSKTAIITLKGNQKTFRTNVNNSWKRAKMWVNINGSWKRGVIWTNVNGSWKRGI